MKKMINIKIFENKNIVEFMFVCGVIVYNVEKKFFISIGNIFI